MDEWADVEGAIKAAIEQRQQRIESLTGFSAILILISAGWVVWPSLSSAL